MGNDFYDLISDFFGMSAFIWNFAVSIGNYCNALRILDVAMYKSSMAFDLYLAEVI